MIFHFVTKLFLANSRYVKLNRVNLITLHLLFVIYRMQILRTSPSRRPRPPETWHSLPGFVLLSYSTHGKNDGINPQSMFSQLFYFEALNKSQIK